MSDSDSASGDARDPYTKALQVLASLHAKVDARAAELNAKHAARLSCRRGCAQCCVDELSVFEIEAERIRQAHPELLSQGEPAPAGRCAFLSPEGACRVYEVRPYVCRTQGLPLRWMEQDDDGEPVELRDICPLNDDGRGAPLESLSAGDCWTVGTVEEALARLQMAIDGGEGRRVRLRDLFERGE